MTDHRAISSSLVTVGDAHSEGCRRPLLHTVALGQLILALILSLSFFFLIIIFFSTGLQGTKDPAHSAHPPIHRLSIGAAFFWFLVIFFSFRATPLPNPLSSIVSSIILYTFTAFCRSVSASGPCPFSSSELLYQEARCSAPRSEFLLYSTVGRVVR